MQAFERIVEEIRHERKKLPDQNPTDQIWLIQLFIAIGQVANALFLAHEEGSGNAYPMRVKLLRVAAIAIQWLEKL